MAMSPFFASVCPVYNFNSKICVFNLFLFSFYFAIFYHKSQTLPEENKKLPEPDNRLREHLKSEYMIRPPKVTQKHGLESFIICQNPL